VSFGVAIEDFPSPDLKRLAFIGFAKESERFDPAVRQWNLEYIGTYKKQYLPYIFENDFAPGMQIIAETGKIDLKEFEAVYLQPAQAANAVQCTALLLAWRNEQA